MVRYPLIYTHAPIESCASQYADPSLAASQMAQQMGAMGPQAPQAGFGPGVDPDKQFLGEAENIAVVVHYSVLDDVEDRLLASVKA